MPHALKFIGYIKHNNVIVLIDNDNTHNFINRRVDEETHYYVCVISIFQIMIANGGMMKCGGHCEYVKLQKGEYHLKLTCLLLKWVGVM